MTSSLTRLTSLSIAVLIVTVGSLAGAQVTPTHEVAEVTVRPGPVLDREAPPDHAQHQPSEIEDPRGNLPLTLLGGAVGLGTTLLISKLLYDRAIEDCAQDADFDEGECRYNTSFGNAVFTLLLAPWLTSAGVFAGGALSGGTGGYGWTLLGGVAGTLPPLALAALMSHLGAGDDASSAVALIGAPLGFVLGAAGAYRWSADDINTSVAISPDGRSAMLKLGGKF